MTFFLNQPTEAPTIKARNDDVDLASGFSDGLGAAITVASLENDANFIARRTTVKTRASKGWELADRLGAEAIEQRARDQGISEQSISIFTRMMDRRPSHMPDYMEAVVFELAGEASADQPEAWADVEFSDDVITAEANAELQAEYEDARATLDMMPGGSGVVSFLGSMIGITADVKNLPFLALGGGGGSIWRTIGQEAMINTAAEAAFLPSQFEMAERLDIPDPDVVTQLSLAAVAGGALGGLVEGGARGISYFQMRNRVPEIPGYDEFSARAMVDQVEDILTSDTPQPFEQIRQLQDEAQAAPYLLENPINPKRPPLIQDAAPSAPQEEPDLLSGLQSAVDEARAADRSAARPLAQFLRDNHKGGGENLQIHPEGMAADELRASGITPKTMPGLFSRNGRKDFDNLVADELEAEFPGIIEATGTQRGSPYLDRDGFLEVLGRDLDRDSSWLQSRAEVEAREADLEAYLREGDGNPADDYTAGAEAEGGMFVDLNEYEFVHGNNAGLEIEQDLDRYLERNGLTFLTKEERAEILDQLQTRGGEAEYLVERIAEREIELATAPLPEDAFDEIPFPDAPEAPRNDGQGTDGAGRSNSDTGTEGTSGTRTEDPPETRTEQTAAGEQVVATGIEPLSQRQQLEARQGAPMRGGDAAADNGLFDLGARAQTDMFDDPASPEARTIQQNVASSFRDEIESNGPTVVDMLTEDGRVLRTDQDVLDYLDEGDQFSSRIDLCGMAPGGET
ncbi:hypothetical protein VWY34_14150 [Phaeobacter sp. JH20_02]|uniref:hypothetical protein n=1 Tax=unclassified Phaeobacter TaxID=2621772 RepID=UPI003A8AA442